MCSFSNKCSHSKYEGPRRNTEREKRDNHQGSEKDLNKSFTLAIIQCKAPLTVNFEPGKKKNKTDLETYSNTSPL